jgi:ABC transport system ATP-binding/permease protein
MLQIKLHNVSVHYGKHPLLEQASFTVDKKDRIAIIGRNGAGKSTLLKILEGSIDPDSGNIEKSPHLKITNMIQHIPPDLSGTVHHYLSQAHQPEHEWESFQVEKVMTQLKLDPNLLLENASGGQIRRTLLAAALVNEPDLLLLDEPTNHLDIESIEWLESFLLTYPKTIIFITHDRAFMQALATRIIEIDLGRITGWQGDYEGFLKNKATQLAAEENQKKLFNKKLSQEETWIRQGIKARRTRNEGRVRALKTMREQYAQRRQRQGTMTIQQDKTAYSGKIVYEIEQVNLNYNNKAIIKDFSTTILRGDKIAIMGPNGCGKSTLIKIITGKVKPNHGTIKSGTQTEVVYFDQHRDQLDLEATAIDNVGDGRQEITIGDQKKHIIGYLQDFLFTPEKARSRVKTFSGGERNRLLLAKLLAKPSNVLILDEPTNDLDMETLEMLDEFLVNYTGTLILVSHDRALLNNVATHTLVFEGNGMIKEYVGGYDDWQRQRPQPTKPTTKDTTDKKTKNKSSTLSYEERKELNKLPKMIEKTENKIKALHKTMSDTDFYQQEQDLINETQAALETLKKTLQQQYQRWEALDEKSS